MDLARAIPPSLRAALVGEDQLRATAAMLARAECAELTAASVVGVLSADDEPRFDELVSDLVDEFGLAATIAFGVGTYSVRFEREC